MIPREAFRIVRRLWKNPLEGPCTLACGKCLFCRVHDAVSKHAQRKKLSRFKKSR